MRSDTGNSSAARVIGGFSERVGLAIVLTFLTRIGNCVPDLGGCMSEAIGILETGVPPGDLAARHGRYDAMVQALLGRAFTTRTYDVQAGELPARPEDHPAYVITGSAAGVYDPLPWIAPLQDFIRQAHGRAQACRHLLRPPGHGGGVGRTGREEFQGVGAWAAQLPDRDNPRPGWTAPCPTRSRS